MDARCLQLPDNLFDMVICKSSLDHMLHDAVEAVQIVREAWRVLRPNGCFCVISSLEKELLDRMIQVSAWNGTMWTQVAVNPACINNQGGVGPLRVALCFK